TNATYDGLNRLLDRTYPSKYGLPSNPTNTIHHDFDTAGRISGVKVDGVDYASNLTYNNASQLHSLNVGPTGALQVTETYEYESLNGLLTNQSVTRGSTSFLNLAYQYTRPGLLGATGQLTQIINNNRTDHQKDRSYVYDMLGRLTAAHGGDFLNPRWTELYDYDR